MLHPVPAAWLQQTVQEIDNPSYWHAKNAVTTLHSPLHHMLHIPHSDTADMIKVSSGLSGGWNIIGLDWRMFHSPVA